MPYYPPASAGGGANTALSNLASTAVNTTIASDTTLTDDLGTSAIYWNNAYAKALNLNSTASIDGATAGIVSVVGAVGLGTSAPTHSLTLPSTSTGIALYNTIDQTTNYERLLIRPNANVFEIKTDFGGTGTSRNLTFTSASTVMTFAFSNTYKIDLTTSSGTANRGGTSFSHTSTASSGVSAATYIAPIINQTATAGYTALLINPTQTATGSGAKNLIDAQVDGVSKFLVNNAGSLTLADAATIDVGTTTGTKIGTATSQKLGFFNATPVVQQTGDIITALSNLGLVATPTLTNITTGYVAKTALYTITSSDSVVDCTSGTFTVTLPTAVGITGRQYIVKNSGAGVITLATTSAQTIDGGATASLAVQYVSITVISDGANWKVI